MGTGKYRSFQEMARAHEASGADMVTVAVRRVNLTDKSKESMLDHIDRSKYFILPNTAGCHTADDAVRTCRLARELLEEFVTATQKVFPGAVLGAILIQTVENGLVIINANPYVYPLVTSGIIFAAVLSDSARTALLAKRTRRTIRLEEASGG